MPKICFKFLQGPVKNIQLSPLKFPVGSFLCLQLRVQVKTSIKSYYFSKMEKYMF